MRTATRHLPLALLSGALAILVDASGARAVVTSSAILTAGETTPDGKLSLVVTTGVDGGQTVSLRNNGLVPIIVDTYRLTPATSTACQGRNAFVPAEVRHYLCTVTFPTPLGTPVPFSLPQAGTPTATPRPRIGHATVEVILTWHEVKPRPRPTPTPSPVPSPSATPR